MRAREAHAKQPLAGATSRDRCRSVQPHRRQTSLRSLRLIQRSRRLAALLVPQLPAWDDHLATTFGTFVSRDGATQIVIAFHTSLDGATVGRPDRN